MKISLQDIEHKMGTGEFWDDKLGKWIEVEELINNKNFIAYDDGGDIIIKSADDATHLIEKLKKHLDNSIYMIVQDGIQKKVIDFLK